MKFTKKDFHLNFLTNLLENKTFLGFFSVNSFTAQDKINLKIRLNKIGFDFKVLKNGLFITALKTRFPKYINIEALSQGFSIVIFPLSDKSNFDFLSLKDLAQFLKNEQNLLFLGGLHDDKLVNKIFLKDIILLKSRIEVYSDLINTIKHSQFSLINSLSKPSTNLVHCIKNIDSDNTI